MAIVYLVRHAQASFGSENYDRLSALGVQQSRWLGEYFSQRGLQFSRVMAGSLVRQRDTAAHILAAMGQSGQTVQEHAGLDEYPGEALYRAYSGRDPVEHQRADYRDYWRTFRAAMQAWTQDRLNNVPESWTDFGERIQSALDTATQDAGRDENLLVVSSGGAIGRAIADIVQSPADIAIELNLQFRNTGFCELLAGTGRMRMLSFNAVPHLESNERRGSITFA